jgi:hypothetical protein
MRIYSSLFMPPELRKKDCLVTLPGSVSFQFSGMPERLSDAAGRYVGVGSLTHRRTEAMKSGGMLWIAGLLSFIVCAGCATTGHVTIDPSPLPEKVMSARWGSPVEEVKKAIDQDSIDWFQDKTDQPPYGLYASGTYLNAPAIVSYFFTPRSKKLYKVTVTLNDLAVFRTARDELIGKFGNPSFSQLDVDHWSWQDKSLVILQRDASHVQISYWSGPFVVLSHEEQKESMKN